MNVERLLFFKDKPIASCCNVRFGQTKVNTITDQIVFGVREFKSNTCTQQKNIHFPPKITQILLSIMAKPKCAELVNFVFQGRNIVMHPKIGQSLVSLHFKVMWSPL